MIQRDYLIIGAGIGGASVCESIRKYDKRGSVTLVGAEVYPPYKRWTLSKAFLREKVPQQKKLPHLEAGWYDSHKIETRLGTLVTQFNIDRRLAVLGNGETIEFNKACLAMGSRPVRPPVAGVGLGNVIYLRTTRDALALREMASLEKTVVVVGGGLLACEVASSLRQLKFKVSMMHRNVYLLNRYIDPETGAWLTAYFEKHGISLLLGESLNGFEGKTVLRNIQTKSGNRVAAGVAVVACGAEPNLDLVRNTPLSGPHGSPVTEYSRDRRERHLRRGRSGVLSGSIDGRGAAANALGQCARTRARRGREHDREEAHPLRTDSVFLDRDVRFEDGFRRRFQSATDARRPEGHAREEAFCRALLSGRQAPRDFALRRVAEGSGFGEN